MTDTNRTPIKQWTVKRAINLAAVCITVGIAGGWSVRGWQSPADSRPAKPVSVSTAMENPANSISQSPSLNQLQAIADAQVAPQLLKLKTDPNNPELLANIGNVYYDAQQYPTAVDYYGRALKAKPSDAAVRTDLGTAYWFMGNADSALTEFNKALTYAPTNPNTLFNRGLVRLKGKQDPAGAISDFEKLLATNPNYEGKDNVEKMMAEAKKQPAVSEEATAK